MKRIENRLGGVGFAKAAWNHRTGRNHQDFGPFLIGNLVGAGCRTIVELRLGNTLGHTVPPPSLPVLMGGRKCGCDPTPSLRLHPRRWRMPPRGPCSWLRWIACLYQPPLLSLAAAGFPFLEGFDLPELLRATAWRTSAVNADSSTASPSWMSIARRTFPSRLELKRRAGSFRDAPLAKVSFTQFL